MPGQVEFRVNPDGGPYAILTCTSIVVSGYRWEWLRVTFCKSKFSLNAALAQNLHHEIAHAEKIARKTFSTCRKFRCKSHAIKSANKSVCRACSIQYAVCVVYEEALWNTFWNKYKDCNDYTVEAKRIKAKTAKKVKKQKEESILSLLWPGKTIINTNPHLCPMCVEIVPETTSIQIGYDVLFPGFYWVIDG